MTCERCNRITDADRVVRARLELWLCPPEEPCECPHYLCDPCFAEMRPGR